MDAGDIPQVPAGNGEKRPSRLSRRQSLVGLAVAGVSLSLLVAGNAFAAPAAAPTTATTAVSTAATATSRTSAANSGASRPVHRLDRAMDTAVERPVA